MNLKKTIDDIIENGTIISEGVGHVQCGNLKMEKKIKSNDGFIIKRNNKYYYIDKEGNEIEIVESSVSKLVFDKLSKVL